MEIPSSSAGVVKELRVKVGDVVNMGSVVLTLERRPGRGRRAGPRACARERVTRTGAGAGPRAGARARGAGAGGVDLRRRRRHRVRPARARRRPRRLFGRVPKRRPRHEGGAGRALRDARRRVPERRLHPVEGAAARRDGDGRGQALRRPRRVVTAPPQLDIAKLRTHKGKVVGKLTGGLAAMAKMRKVTVVRGYGNFIDPFHVKVDETSGEASRRRATRRRQVQAGRHRGRLAGRAPAVLPERSAHRRLHRRARTARHPEAMLIVGGGIIGLEMGTVYSTLGARSTSSRCWTA
jgi:dihydrolipoamide dehydrogenase